MPFIHVTPHCSVSAMLFLFALGMSEPPGELLTITGDKKLQRSDKNSSFNINIVFTEDVEDDSKWWKVCASRKKKIYAIPYLDEGKRVCAKLAS